MSQAAHHTEASLQLVLMCMTVMRLAPATNQGASSTSLATLRIQQEGREVQRMDSGHRIHAGLQGKGC